MSFLKIENGDGLTTISLNRPEKRNAMNGEMINEWLTALRLLAQQSSTRILLIKGNGNDFCAGADLNWMREISQGSFENNYDDAQHLADVMYELYSFPKPTIALAQGSSFGGGIGLLASCDIVMASLDAQFAFSEVKIGITPAIVSPYVIAAMGERMAHYYFLTGETFDALEAKRIGLVHRVTEKDALLSTGVMLGNQIKANGPKALMATKELIRHVAKKNISSELSQKTAEHLSDIRASPEAQEGFQAFLEKRKPVWNKG